MMSEQWTTLREYGQWKFQESAAGDKYRLVNLDPDDNTRRYYQVVNGQYGQPLIEPEPDLALPLPTKVSYVNATSDLVTPDMLISGIIVRDGNGKVLHRVSLTNAKTKGISLTLRDNGELDLDGDTFHLMGLFVKDKNRVGNYDAFFAPTKPDSVVLLELEDVVFSS